MRNNSDTKRIWMVAAGTGGHIFPGLALANEIKLRHPNVAIEFFGTKDRLEEKIIPRHGYPITFLRAKQWKGRGIADRVRSMWALVRALFFVFGKATREHPICLISVGGYVSMPVGLACWLKGVPIFLVEPNIRAGISNRILSQFSAKAFSVPRSDALAKFKCPTFDTGNPVVGKFGPNPLRNRAENLLILGGSQGARILCSVGLNVFANLRARGLNLRILLQSGDKNLEDALELKKSLKLGTECEVLPFLDDVPERLRWADLVIARAGAMTLTELSLACVPSVLVPYPSAADDHQRVNARIMEDEGAVRVVDEKEKDFEDRLELAVSDLMAESNSFDLRRELAKNMAKFARPDAAQSIVSEILLSL